MMIIVFVLEVHLRSSGIWIDTRHSLSEYNDSRFMGRINIVKSWRIFYLVIDIYVYEYMCIDIHLYLSIHTYIYHISILAYRETSLKDSNLKNYLFYI